MKYTLTLEFKKTPVCHHCMLCRVKGQDSNNESTVGCAALGIFPKCPDEGCRDDCPLIANEM